MKHNFDHIRNESEFILDCFRIFTIRGITGTVCYEIELSEQTSSDDKMLKRAGIIKLPKTELVKLKDLILDALSN